MLLGFFLLCLSVLLSAINHFYLNEYKFMATVVMAYSTL